MLDKVKEFLKTTKGVIVLAFATMLSVIYYLLERNNSLEAENSLNNTNLKDKDLDNKINNIKDKQKEEQDKQSDLDKNRQDASKEDPEDFWKKH